MQGCTPDSSHEGKQATTEQVRAPRAWDRHTYAPVVLPAVAYAMAFRIKFCELVGTPLCGCVAAWLDGSAIEQRCEPRSRQDVECCNVYCCRACSNALLRTGGLPVPTMMTLPACSRGISGHNVSHASGRLRMWSKDGEGVVLILSAQALRTSEQEHRQVAPVTAGPHAACVFTPTA